MISTFILWASLAVLIAVPAVLVIHEDYEDCIAGRLFLLTIGVTAVVMALEEIHSPGIYELPGETLWLIVGGAGFLAWHFVRWRRHLARAKKAQSGEIERRVKEEPA